MKTIYFAKTKENAIIPSKQPGAVGYNFYPCFEEESMTINPGETASVPSGIVAAFDNGQVLLIKELSGTGLDDMSRRMGVIDSGYHKEILIGINNTGKKAIIITKNPENFNAEAFVIHDYTKAIAQGLVLALPEYSSQEISFEKIKKIKLGR